MKKVKVVVVIEGGNVQEIFTNVPGVEVVKVDYDVDGMPREELKKVQQDDGGGKKSFALASVRQWGEALVYPKDTKRFFRNASI